MYTVTRRDQITPASTTHPPCPVWCVRHSDTEPGPYTDPARCHYAPQRRLTAVDHEGRTTVCETIVVELCRHDFDGEVGDDCAFFSTVSDRGTLEDLFCMPLSIADIGQLARLLSTVVNIARGAQVPVQRGPIGAGLNSFLLAEAVRG